MKILVGIVISAGVVLAGGQTAVQTIDLPALDRSRIVFRFDAKPAIVVGPAQVPGAYFRRENDVVGLSGGRIALATPWGVTALHVVDPTGKVDLLRKAAQPESGMIMDVSEYDVRVYRFRRN